MSETTSPVTNNGKSNNTPSYEVFTQMHEQILAQPFDYVMKYMSKTLSNSVSKIFNKIPNMDEKLHREIMQFLETFIKADLLVEDVRQETCLQSGVPGAHHIFGLPMAINTAHYMKAKAIDRFLKQVPADKISITLAIIVEQMLEFHQAEGLNIHLKSKKDHNEKELSKLSEEKQQAIIKLGVRMVEHLNSN